MLPPKKLTPPKRPERIQPNRLFDNTEEIQAFISAHHKGAKIVKTWEVKQLACIIQL